jgi:hypothetical protein
MEGLPMDLIRQALIVAVLGTMFLGIAAVNAQVSVELPQFKSGASVMMGVPVDFNVLSQRVGTIYDVVESDDSHIVWKFTGTTGNWAFVFADGRIVVASTVDFNLDAKDTLTKELSDVMDMLNAVFAGIISDEARNNALDSAVYYASEPEIYHRLKYDFKSSFDDFTLVVPDWTSKKARFTVTGGDNRPECYGDINQLYLIDDNEVTSCNKNCCGRCYCEVQAADITDKISVGSHKISAKYINDPHMMIIEVVTSPLPPRTLVLYGPGYNPWINETGKSMTIDDMNLLVAGNTAT